MLTFVSNSFPWFGEMLDLGGDILLLIIVLAALLWTLIIERFYYLHRIYPHQALRATYLWRSRSERRSWYAYQFRQRLTHKSAQCLQANMGLIKVLITLCPLLGLLGTVVGMLEIFDAVAITGGNNPRATASGVSKAIITTMAGMVVAISALPVVGLLNRSSAARSSDLINQLKLDG